MSLFYGVIAFVPRELHAARHGPFRARTYSGPPLAPLPDRRARPVRRFDLLSEESVRVRGGGPGVGGHLYHLPFDPATAEAAVNLDGHPPLLALSALAGRALTPAPQFTLTRTEKPPELSP